jgi:beta-glucanase (GH16 family)
MTASAGGMFTSFTMQLNAAILALSINATSLAFGDVQVNTPSTQSVTLASTGSLPVTIIGATLTGAGFTVPGAVFPTILSPGQAATLNIEFDPTTVGTATGQLTIASNSSTNGTAVIGLTGTGTAVQAAAPVISTALAQNGAKVVTLTTATPGATIYYTLDGSTPSTASQVYEAPLLVASNLTMNAIATASGEINSNLTSQAFSLGIPSGTLVWSDEFTNTTGSYAQPNSQVWTYDTGAGGWGNSELEHYCASGSSVPPCNSSSPNAFVGIDGYLHIVAQQPSSGVYTSARLKTQGLFSFQYGRLEVRAQVPEAQGLWPGIWLLGNTMATVNWPACGEQDVLERANAATSPDWILGSIHGTGFTGTNLGTLYEFSSGQTAAGWHTYGMIWSKGSVSYYVDDPTTPYATYTTSNLGGFSGAVWPFDSGDNFIILNLAVGGNMPGNPNSSTPFPSEMLVGYVRIYTN